jgi:hypothetical protein
MVRIPFHGFLEIDIKSLWLENISDGTVWGCDEQRWHACPGPAAVPGKPLGFSILHYGPLIFV